MNSRPNGIFKALYLRKEALRFGVGLISRCLYRVAPDSLTASINLPQGAVYMLETQSHLVRSL
jgi:hypothetical protein